MAAIVSGGALGLVDSSLAHLGALGQVGLAAHGRAGERFYVNAATGNLVIQGQDEILVGRGPDAAFLRTYNSRGLLNDDNGDNWRLNFHRRVFGLTGTANTAGSTVRRVDADGAEAVYTYNASLGKYVTTDGSGAYDTLSVSGGTWTFTDGDTGLRETYDAANSGRLTSVVDESGNTLTFAYNAAGLLTDVVTTTGSGTHSVHLEYHAGTSNLKQIQRLSGGTQVRTSYLYDASNRLTQVTTDLTPANTADAQTYVTTYTYDGTSRRVASMTQSDGTSLAFAYVDLGGGDWRVASVTDALGRITGVSYNVVARTTTVTDPLGHTTILGYDSANRLISVSMPAAGSQQLAFAYDAAGNVASVTDAQGNAVVFAYDANGNRIYERDAAGNVAERVYGSSNQLLAETAYRVPDPDGAGAGAPSGALTTRYVYDAAVRLRFLVSADGRVTEQRYDGFGQRVASIQYTGAAYAVSGLAPTATLTEAQLTAWLPVDRSRSMRVDTAYDFRGQVVTLTTYAAVDAAGNGVAAGQAVTQFVSDAAGNLLTTIDARGGSASTVYDGLGRVLSSTNALGQLTLSQYDDANRKIVVTAANGLVRTASFSAAGELISVLESANAQTLGETKYFYDADGRLRRTEDPTGVRTHVLYDAADRKVAEIDGDGSLIEFRYDSRSNPTRTVRYATAVSAAALASLTDAQGKPLEVAVSAIRPAANAGDRSAWVVYDSASRIVKTVDEGGFVTQNFYDGAGQLTDVVRYATAIAVAGLGDSPTAGAINPPSSSTDRLSRTFYDTDGNVAAVLDGEGFLAEIRYDAAGRSVEQIAYATATNPALRTSGTLDQLRPAASSADIHSYTLYNARGQAAGEVDGEGYLTEAVYDAAGNKTQVIRYATRVTYTAGASLASLRPAANPQDQVKAQAYDALNRVVSETAPDGTVKTHAYDAAGNVVSTTLAAGTADARGLNAQYDRQGRLTAELTGVGSALLTGNQTQAEVDAIWNTYATRHTYDAAGRRTSTTDPLGNKTRFYYDADGRVAYKINALGEVQRLVYDAHGELVQSVQYGKRLPGTALATLNGGLVDAAVTSAVSAIADPLRDTVVSLAYDSRGNLRQTTDALGFVETQTRNAFGDIVAKSQQIAAGQTLEHTYAYDRRGLLTQTVWDPAGLNTSTVTQYDAFGRPVQNTDAKGNVRRASYDKLGRVVSLTDPLNATRSLTYDAFERVLTSTDALGRTTTYAYDTANRTTTVTTPEGVVTTTLRNRHGEEISITDGRGNTTTHQYDRNGNLVVSTAPDAGTTSSVYDRADRVIETVDARGVRTTFTYDAVGRALTRVVDPGGLALATTFVYDAKGQAIVEIDANGVQKRTSYDLKGQVAAVMVDPEGLRLETTFAYDGRGKKLTVVEGAGSAQQRVTVYAYDKLGRLLTERVDPAGLNITTTFAYDANDNVVRKTDANGNVTRQVYDANDRPVYTVDPLGGVTKSEYDAEGRVVRFIAYANAISLAGLAATPSIADIAARVVASAGDAIKGYVYDADGRELYCVDALGGVIQKIHDANGNLVRQVAYATPIAAGTPLTAAAVQAALVVNAADQVTRFIYDAANRPIHAIDATGAVARMHYDANGNVTRTRAFANAVALGGDPTQAQLEAALVPSAADRVTRHVYDAANRLVYEIDAESYVKETRHDNLGRITQTVQYPLRVEVGSFPTLAEVATALGSSPPASVVNTTATQYANPVQSYTYAASANNDVQGTVTQNVTGSAQNTQVLRDPTQPYAYAASARNDVATPSTQAVGVTSASATVSNSLLQPYTFIGSAKSDSTSSATQNVALSVQNTSITQSTNVANNAWYRSGTTLVQGAGLSIVAGSVGHTDNTPTGVRAKLFQNNILLSTVNMDVGTTTVQSWQVPNAWDEFGNPISWTTVSGTKWNNVSGWTGQVNISTGTLTPGAYTIVLEAWDTAQAAQAPNTLYDLADGTWSFTNTINVNVGLVVQPTYVRWATSTQPAGTTSVALRFRTAGSTGAYTNATVGVSGTNHEANLGSLAAGNYEYIIEYRDTYGRLLKSAAGTVTSTAGQTTSASAAFSYTTYASTAAAGTSIRYFATAAQWAPVDHVNATVKDNLGNVVATAVTYPEAESGYNGEVNLKVGSALADGTYTVELTLFNKNGSTTTVTPFTYQVGPQTRLQQTISWAASTQPAGTTASFKYRTQGSTGAYTSAPIAVAGANQQVVLDFMPAGNYEYIVEYRDSYNRLLKNGGGTFTVAASGSTTTNVNFAYTAYTSTASAGSSISGYIALAQVPTIERVEALVKDYFTNATVSTATTLPEFEPGYAGNVNLKVGSPLATGRYNVTVTVFRKDGTSSAATFYYEVGQQQHWNPVQPSPYIASAKADTTSASTVAIAVSNATEFQSAVIANVGWTRSGSTLVQGAGRSVVAGTVTATDLTPTLVRATIFQGATQVAQVTTDVGSQTTENWQVPVAWDEYGTPIQWRPASGTRWSAVSNWNRQANLSASLAPGHYRIVFEARDDAQAAQVENTFYDLTDATWTATNTLNDVVIGTITQPTVLAWAASTQPAGTTSVSFGYRAAGSTGAYTSVAVTTGANQQASIAGLANGSYEYQIEYRGAAGQVLKYSRGNFTSTQGGSSSVSASFTTYTSASGAGSSIRHFTQASQWATVERVSATVKDQFGNIVSTALTYPEAEAGYNGEVNLKAGAALADGRYTVELTLYNRNGTSSTVAPFLYEIGERSRLQHTLSWPAATQPAGTTPRFTFRPQGSTGGWASAAVSVNGASQQVLLDWIVAGNYEFKIEYRDSFDRVIKSASGTLTAATSGASSPTLVFSFDGYTSTPTTGSSITGYIPLAQVPSIASVQAVVKDFVSGATVSTATTLPEFEPGYAGNVNLKAGGAPLADGRYNVTVTINRKDGTSTSSTFYYEVGPQPYAHRTTTLSWSAANQPSGTTVEFTYGPAGQAQTAATVTHIESSNTYQVSFIRDNDDGVVTGLPDGTYDYTVRYKSGNEVLREARGQFVANASSSVTTSLNFAPSTVSGTFRNDTVYSGTATQQLVQPYAHLAAAKSDSATPTSQAVAIAVSNATEFQSAVIANVGWTRSGSTLVQGAGRSVVAGTVTATDLTPTLVRATIFQGATQVAQVTTDVGSQTTENWQVPVAWDEYGTPIQWRPASGTRWSAVSNWNRQANLSASLAPGHYRIVFEARDDAQAAQVENTFYDLTDATWTATNTLNDVVIGTITQPTVLAWAASTQPAGTASVSFEYRSAGSTGAYSSATVTSAGANQQASIAGLANGNYEYRIQYKDSYGRILKSANGNFTSTQGGSSSVAATFNYTAYASAAAAGSSIRYFTQSSQWAPVDHVNATVKDAVGNVVSTAVTYPEAEAGYNGEVNLKVGAALADGRYTVELTIYNKNGTTSTVVPFLYEVGAQLSATRTTTLSWSAANQPAGTTVELAYRRAGQGGAETIVAPVLVNGSYRATFTYTNQGGIESGLADGIYDYTVRYKQGAAVVSQARGQFTSAAGEQGAFTLNFTPTSYVVEERVNTFAYDRAGRLLQSTDALGFSESYGYDALGNRTSFTSKKGSVWTYAYDQASRMVEETSPAVSVTAAGGAVQTGVSLRTRLQYDALGNVVAYTEAYGRPEARTTLYQYDALGRQVRTTFPTVGIYNPAADNLATNSGATINRTETATALYSQVSYDTLGRAVVNRATDGAYSYKVYDAEGRVRYDIDAEYYVTEHRYDRFGNESATIRYAQRLNSAGHGTGAAWSIAEVGTALTAGAQDRRIDKLYDRNNRVVEVVEPQAYVYDPVNNAGATAGRRTLSEYNAFGEVVRQRMSYAVDALGNVTSWADSYFYFDARGARVAQIDAEGYLTESRYDAAGNLTRQVEYAKRAAAGWSTAGYVKPPAGDADSGYDRTTAYAYDLANRKVAETRVGLHFAALSGATGVVDATGDATTSFGYDAVGNQVSVTDANGATLYTYFDALGRTVAVAAPTRLSADPSRGGASLTPLSTFGLDAFGKTVRQTLLANSATAASAAGYTAGAASSADQVSTTVYDAHGNAVQETDAEGAARYFSYDAAGRVAKSWQPITERDLAGAVTATHNRVETFQYDAVGNQVATLDSSTRRNYFDPSDPAAGNLGITPSGAIAQSASFNPQYDEYGNLIGGWQPSNTVNASWGLNLAALGGGEVKVVLAYNRVSGGATSREFVLGGGTTTGATLSWNDSHWTTGYGIASITSISLSKKDAAGNWVVLHSGANGSGSTLIGWQQSASGPTSLAYRASPGAAWSTATITNFGAMGVADLRAAGSVEFEARNASGGSYAYQRGGASSGAINTSVIVAEQRVAFNAFGEITSKSIDGRAGEYFDYDNAGHLWRTNQESGVDTVYLYDLQGKATGQIRSMTADLRTYASAAAVDTATRAPGAAVRTETQYDKLERAVRSELPAFGAVGPSVVHAPFPAPTQDSWSVSHDGYWSYDEYGNATWNGSDKIAVNWTSLAGWGSGDIRVQADVTTSQSGASSIVRSVGASAFTGANVAIGEDITAVSRVRVLMQNTAGQYVVVRDSFANNSRWLTLPTPVAQPGDYAVLRYKPAGTATWSSITANNFGPVSMIDTNAWANGTYDYEVQYKHADGTVYSTGGGTLTLTSTAATVTPAGPQTVVPVVSQTLDRWGNTLSLIDPRFGTDPTPTFEEWERRYRYDEQSRVLSETSPLMTVQDANGGIRNIRAVTRNFYDRLGNAIGLQDANAVDADVNGNGVYEYASTARYNAAGQVTRQVFADGGVLDYVYDVFGRQTGDWDARNYFTARAYDRANRLTQITRPDGTTQQYRYDELGNRVWEKDGRGYWQGYGYDSEGHIIRATKPGGQTTWTFYDQLGRRTREINANGESQFWRYDEFGKVIQYVDLAGYTTTNTYNRLGQTATSSNARSSNTYTYDVNGALKRIDNSALSPDGTAWWAQSTAYQYDAAGNRSRETFIKQGTLYSDAVLAYDAWNRLVDVNDLRYHLSYTYDANGNRRHTTASYFNNAGVYVNPPKEYWYTYDRMNRLLLTQGVLSGGNIVVGSQGTLLSYDTAGNRVSANGASTSGATETYFYDSLGRLTQTNRNGAISNFRVYDASHNVTQSNTYNASGVLTSFQVNTYDANGWLTQSDAYKHFAFTDAGGAQHALSALSSRTTYTNRDGLGQVTRYSIAVHNPQVHDAGWGDEYGWHPNVWVTNPHQYTNTYNYTYAKFGGAYREAVVSGTSTHFQAGTNTTRYDGNGAIFDIKDQFQSSNFRSFITDQFGRILQKTQGGQTEYYFYAGDKPLGATGANGAGDFDFNYTPVTSRPAIPAGPADKARERVGFNGTALQDGSAGSGSADKDKLIFDYPTMTPANYVVSAGETLRSIAQAVYGDGGLWYLIADANGLAPNQSLTPGMDLKIPNRITNLHNSYQTFKPYEPAKIIGDTTPTLPDPPPPPRKKGGCGAIGLIIIAVIAIVVTAIVAPYVTAALVGTLGPTMAGVVGAAVGAAAGSIASQGVGIAIGVQDKFNWGAVAVAALSAGITAGVLGTGYTKFTDFGNAIGPIGRAVVGNAISQGVGIVLGQQKSFSWASIAGAAVGAAVSEMIAPTSSQNGGTGGPNPQTTFEQRFAGNLFGSLAGGLTRAALQGGKIDFVSIAADAFGNAIGSALAEQIKLPSEIQKILDDAYRPPMPQVSPEVRGFLRRLAELPEGYVPGEFEGAGDLTIADAVALQQQMLAALGAGNVQVAGLAGLADTMTDGDVIQVGFGEGMNIERLRAIARQLLLATDKWIKAQGDSLDAQTATQLGLAYGALKGFAAGFADLAELAANGGIVLLDQMRVPLFGTSAASLAFGQPTVTAAYKYFTDMWVGIRALISDPVGVLSQVYGERLNQISQLQAEGKHFSAASILGEMVFEAVTLATGVVGGARALTRLTVEAAKKISSAVALAQNIARRLADITEGLISRANLAGVAHIAAALERDLPALTQIGMRAAERAARDGLNLERELLGITYGHLRMVDRGYQLVGELAYGAGHGLDMIFRKADGNGGWIYAVLEAKNGRTLGRLGEAGGFTQGSMRYIEYQLNEFLRARGLNITAAEHALVRELQAGLSAGTLESFVSLQEARRLAQLNLSTFTTGINQNLQQHRYFLQRHVPPSTGPIGTERFPFP